MTGQVKREKEKREKDSTTSSIDKTICQGKNSLLHMEFEALPNFHRLLKTQKLCS